MKKNSVKIHLLILYKKISIFRLIISLLPL